MRKSRYSEEQISRVLQEVEPGRTVKEVCREHGIATGTYCSWKAKLGGMDVNEARWLRELETENRRLKSRRSESKPPRTRRQETGDARGPAHCGEPLPGSARPQRAQSLPSGPLRPFLLPAQEPVHGRGRAAARAAPGTGLPDLSPPMQTSA